MSAEDALAKQVLDAGLPAPVRELVFAPPRRFRFDFAWPDHKLAVEVDGGVFSGGRHTTGAGYTRDCEKFALAAINGWSVIRCTSSQVKTGQAVQWIRDWFARRSS